jgi:hypothetical protein
MVYSLPSKEKKIIRCHGFFQAQSVRQRAENSHPKLGVFHRNIVKFHSKIFKYLFPDANGTRAISVAIIHKNFKKVLKN